MQHITGIRIDAGLSLPSHTAISRGFQAFAFVQQGDDPCLSVSIQTLGVACSFRCGRPSIGRLWFLSLHVHACVMNSSPTQKKKQGKRKGDDPLSHGGPAQLERPFFWVGYLKGLLQDCQQLWAKHIPELGEYYSRIE